MLFTALALGFVSCGGDDDEPTPEPTPTPTPTPTDTTVTPTPPAPTVYEGWPANYDGVMLQGFYWDGYADAQWTQLERQVDELATTFDLVWLPQSGNCGGQSMGYDDLYWFPGHYDSSFGTEEELRSLISTFKAKGIGAIADVVINHRRNISNWVDFPQETYKGVTYQLLSSERQDKQRYWRRLGRHARP